MLTDRIKKIVETEELPSTGDRDSLLVQPLADSASGYVADDMADLTSDIEPKYATEINNCAANITHKTSEEVVNALLEAVDAWLQTKVEGGETPELAFFLKQIDTKALLKRLQQYAKDELVKLAKTLAITAMEATELVEQAETLKSDLEQARDLVSEIVDGDEQVKIPAIGKITIRIVFKNSAVLDAASGLAQATSEMFASSGIASVAASASGVFASVSGLFSATPTDEPTEGELEDKEAPEAPESSVIQFETTQANCGYCFD